VMAHSGRLVFVHAGVRPGVAIEDQKEQDLLYIRSAFFESAHLLDYWVVHGHTPVVRPLVEGRRVNIDTGAYLGGPLTAVRLSRKGGVFLTS